MPSSAPELRVDELRASYPQTGLGPRLEVLGGLSLSLSTGTFVALVGPNGCGKTTLLLCIAGLLRPDSGVIEFRSNGKSGRNVGLVFQNYRESLFPWLTVRDNIGFGLRGQGLSAGEAGSRAGRLCEELGISLPLTRYPYELSGGQQQLASILRALITEPRILLLDEPFGSLDAITREELRPELLKIWRLTGTTCLLVTHDVDDALSLSDRIIVLSRKPSVVAMDVDVPPPVRDHADPQARWELRLRVHDGLVAK